MKKTSKYISAFIASALVALSLCSCEKIDNMRARQILKNTSGDELFYNGSTYNFMLHDEYDSYQLIASEYTRMYYDEMMKITDADVPALLIDRFGDQASISGNNDIIKDEFNHKIYVKADVFNKYEEYIKNLKFDHYFLQTSYHDLKEDCIKISSKFIPNDLVDEISEIKKHPENYKKCNESTVLGSRDIMKCDAEMLFKENFYTQMQILFSSDAFAIEFYDQINDEYVDVMLPEKYFSTLQELFADDDSYNWYITHADEFYYD